VPIMKAILDIPVLARYVQQIPGHSLWSPPAFVDTSLGAITRLEVDLTKRKRRQFTPEFKADGVTVGTMP
jgi:hypothetical protein